MTIDWNSAENVYFELNDDFIKDFKWKQPKWGYNGLGYVVYKRTYSRSLPNGKTEEYWQTIKRVVEGVFTIQKRHCVKNQLPWSEAKARKSAERMYQLMWEFKFTPPGRGLWMMGTDYVYTNGSACLNNCAFISTETVNIDFAEPFCFLMDMSMLGVGMGFDTKGAGKITIRTPKILEEVFVVEDTREGWVELIRKTLNSYYGKDSLPKEVDYSKVRLFGEQIKGFGGVASGPDPLIELYNNIQKLLNTRIGDKLKSTDIVDLFNLVGKAVVSGNVRRTAELALGNPDDKEFIELKDPDKQTNFWGEPENYYMRWASNNSILATVGMDYKESGDRTGKNGEPGYVWLDNIKKYSRMNKIIDNKDYRCSGTNPCSEQSLEDRELCTLVESYPSKHDNLKEWIETLKYAYMYGKTVTLLPTHNKKTNAVMARNRRIGCSITGITQAFKKFGRRNFLEACEKGYEAIQAWDNVYSEWLAIPKSIKTTSIKPSGTISLLAGVTPGIHYPISEYYIRNVRFGKGSPLLEELKNSGYTIESDKYGTDSKVVSFPVKEEYFDRSVQEVSMWEQLENAAQLQEHWADNQVSVTISFSKEEAKDIKNALELYETRLKSVSFLPKADHGYEQAPYITIDKNTYEKKIEKISTVRTKEDVHDQQDLFCDGETCQINIVSKVK